MAKINFVCRYVASLLGVLAALALPVGVGAPLADPTPVHATSRLSVANIGLVINTADPYSKAVGQYYVQKRQLKPEQVLRIELPLKSTLEPAEFARLEREIKQHFGATTQAMALAWTQPYAVQCNSITGALALGFDADLCRQGCARSKPSRYFNSGSWKPSDDSAARPSMLLAAPDVEQAKALIDRGVAADGTLGLRGAPPANAYFVATSDAARNVRARLFPQPGLLRRYGVDVKVEQGGALMNKQRLLIYEIGLAKVGHLDTLEWVNGALADHLTSFGGQLDRHNGQTTALDWIASGATASYGTVSEPCNHPQKFPHPQLVLQHYLQGSTAIEAYWKSVAWPQQGVFVGEPLAAPFAR